MQLESSKYGIRCKVCITNPFLNKHILDHLKTDAHTGKYEVMLKTKTRQPFIDTVLNSIINAGNSTLLLSEHQYRFNIVHGWVKCALPINKLNEFSKTLFSVVPNRKVLPTANNLATTYIPLVFKIEKDEVLRRIKGRMIGVSFDGTS